MCPRVSIPVSTPKWRHRLVSSSASVTAGKRMEFPVGFLVEHDHQVYRPIRTIVHTRKDGERTSLIEWSTNCPGCGTEFNVISTLLFRNPRRRCDSCKAPGRTVKADRKSFRRKIKGVEP
jgi:hypothetical protein